MKPGARLRLVLGLLAALSLAPLRAELADTIERIKPALVVVGTYNPLKSPAFVMRGSGFAVGDGTLVATNDHVIRAAAGDGDTPDQLAILVPAGTAKGPHRAELSRRDAAHDLALLRHAGPPLPALTLGLPDSVREGQPIAFSGFPIGGALGFSPVTHHGIVASITPVALPPGNARDLKNRTLKQLRSGAFPIFQLDATAYPGNSGGPLFDPASGAVLGVLNMVFVKSTKESLLEKPSGISYAIPARHLAELLARER